MRNDAVAIYTPPTDQWPHVVLVRRGDGYKTIFAKTHDEARAIALAERPAAAGEHDGSRGTEPIVDGVVVVQRGQTVVGRVAEAKKVDGVHRLGLELSSITLADGSQAPIQSKLFTATGPTTPTGQQVGTVAATTAVSSAISGASASGRPRIKDPPLVFTCCWRQSAYMLALGA